MRKKILYAVTRSVWGGAQQYVYDLATSMPQGRFEIAVAAGSEGILLEKLRAAGVRTIIVPSLKRNVGFLYEFAAFWHLLKLFRKERPDVIHLNSSKAGALGALAAFVYRNLQPTTYNLKPKIIFTVHGWGFNEDRPFIARMLIWLVSWIASLFQDRIIVLNTADYRSGAQLIPRRKLVLIPHGLAPIEFLPRTEARAFFTKKIGRPIAANTILIGTIAELTKNKGLSYFIEAIRNLQATSYKLQAIVIGEGEDHTKLQAAIKTAKLEGTVFLSGFIPDAAQYLKALDIFVLPSVKEGLPYALMQAMAAGLPVAATRVGGISDLIEDDADGLLVRPKDPPALAAALQTLISSSETRARLASRARQKIETKFQFRAMIEDTIAIYDRKTHQ